MKREFVYAPPTHPLSYIYTDNELIIVEKPSGLLSVPGKTEPDCLEARLRIDFPEALTIHRLDMATSGVMVFARNANAQRHVGLQFEKRMTEKTYLSRVWGQIDKDTGQIDLPLITDWPNRPKQMVCHERGKASLTQWKILEREKTSTYVALFPKTGRSHQLRVHMLALGHPILGDRLYAHEEAFASAPRLQLHAHKLKLRKPTGGDWVEFESPCPF
ncbi:pseudouridine synthase [Hellea balneolensis]|uniref:pseudouridine synthase n=1 Tax=Hellea balneolensis TaxID=287478 RepID=UPI00042122C7|nr:pseudouridine synthase [Hellea balneolensis]